MKTIKSKKLNREVNTICDFSSTSLLNSRGETDNPTGTDPTNTTMTVIITTINTHIGNQKLTA
jgi:hypothetical protein